MADVVPRLMNNHGSILGARCVDGERGILRDHTRNVFGISNRAILRRTVVFHPGVAVAAKMPQPVSKQALQDSEKNDDKRNSRASRSNLMEEDIYTIDDGWKVNFAPTEEMMDVAGVQIPVRLNQQLRTQRPVRRVLEKRPTEPTRSTHKMLRVMSGSCAGKKLTSPADAKVRPMMEVVRGAVFNILKSLNSSTPTSPSGRWLDLYSGTGSVAIEALSRGCCSEAHFVEMDPWVISNVLQPNLQDTNFQNQAVIHTSKVEILLQQAANHGVQFLGGTFDYISVTPPYEAVVYTELMAQLSESPLISETTFMIVEYPLKSKHEMPDSCGALVKFRDRRYGRTNVAIYGPQWLERDD